MEITELNLIGDFEAGIKCLQQNHPSILSNLSLIPQLYSYWTWGALLIAVFATFTNIFNRLKTFIYSIRFKLITSCQKTCQPQTFDQDDFDFDFSDDEDCDDDTPSSVADSDDQELDSEDENVVFRHEGQNGDFALRRRNGFSWSDFSAGKSVVQLWDSFGLGLDFEDDEYDNSGEIGIWDVNMNSGRRGTAAKTPENVVVTADVVGGFGGYDCRMGGKLPEILAAWRPRPGKLWMEGGGAAGKKVE
uniref:uncharacterized protein LOC122596309 n=1 Tax=Erigeron canadensis TaxID=72917 RepID=UPI001CB901C7|nr:uncharacterized protein LOC122596309 [Erigeron canadensis]